jgi:hypothetical protein
MFYALMVQYVWANMSAKYVSSGSGSYKFRLINQRQDYAFGFFSGGLDKVGKLTDVM